MKCDYFNGLLMFKYLAMFFRMLKRSCFSMDKYLVTSFKRSCKSPRLRDQLMKNDIPCVSSVADERCDVAMIQLVDLVEEQRIASLLVIRIEAVDDVPHHEESRIVVIQRLADTEVLALRELVVSQMLGFGLECDGRRGGHTS